MQKLLFVLSLFFLGSALAVRSHWALVGRANPQAQVTIRFALSQRNLDVLESTLLDVADTTSANYGQWWSAEAIADLVAPSASVSSEVVQYLRAQGLTNIVNHRDSIKVVASVSQLEDLLHTSLYSFVHKTQKKPRGSFAQ